jgi:hypothetical protein
MALIDEALTLILKVTISSGLTYRDGYRTAQNTNEINVAPIPCWKGIGHLG